MKSVADIYFEVHVPKSQ